MALINDVVEVQGNSVGRPKATSYVVSRRSVPQDASRTAIVIASVREDGAIYWHVGVVRRGTNRMNGGYRHGTQEHIVATQLLAETLKFFEGKAKDEVLPLIVENGEKVGKDES